MIIQHLIDKTIRILFLLSVISILISCGGAGGGGGSSGGSSSSPAGFTIYTIDNTNNVGMYTSIATGSVHIAYYDKDAGKIKYTSNTSGSWSSPIIIGSTTDPGLSTTITSIALDPSGNVHVAYYYNNLGRLIYTACPSTSNCTQADNWTAAVVDASADVGSDVSMTADLSDGIHISYYDATNKDLKYAACTSNCTNPANWKTVTVDNNLERGEYTSIAVDSSNHIHISYYDADTDVLNGDLRYATCSSDCTNPDHPEYWTTIAVDSSGDVGYNSSIAVNAGRIHISYYDFDNGNLKYALCSSNCTQSSNWATTTTDVPGDAGEYSSIALDSSSKVHISYYDKTNDKLKYATNASGSWVTNTVDSASGTGEYSAISVDAGDTIHISYYDSTNSALKYAVK